MPHSDQFQLRGQGQLPCWQPADLIEVRAVDMLRAVKSRLAALRERRLRRQEEGRDPDYERARREQERRAIQEATADATLDTSTLNCPAGSNRGPARATIKQTDSLKRP